MNKKYVKPKAEIRLLTSTLPLSSLNDWLSDNQLEGVGITTYLIQS